MAIRTRLMRAEEAKEDGRKFAAFFAERDPVRAERLCECGTWLMFRRYVNLPEKPTVLAGGSFCKQHLLCGFCSAGRSARNVLQLREKIEHVCPPACGLVPYMITLTAKSQANLPAMIKHVTGAWEKMVRRRRNARAGRCASVMGLFAGGFVSIEVKRGKGGHGWHVHLHGIVLGPGGRYQPIWEAFKREWAGMLGQTNASVQLQPIKGGLTNGLIETLKYAVKWEPQAYADRWEAAKALRGIRAVRCFGNLHGLKLTDDVTDDLAEFEGEEFEELVFCFIEEQGGYVQTRGSQERYSEFDEWNEGR